MSSSRCSSVEAIEPESSIARWVAAAVARPTKAIVRATAQAAIAITQATIVIASKTQCQQQVGQLRKHGSHALG